MGLEQIGEQKKIPFRFEELEQKEKEVLEEIRAIFKKNADLSAELLPEDHLDLSDRQKGYLSGQLKIFGREAKEILGEVEGEEEACNYYKKAV